MADDGNALDSLREHNEQLSLLLSFEGRMQLNRLVLLEMAIHAYTDGRLSEYEEMPENALSDLLRTELQGIDLQDKDADRLAADILNFMKVPDAVKNVGKKVGSVANSYVKSKAGVILGGSDAADSDDSDD